jgi:protein-S-isoprenylcysteine O-methyltransferase
MIIIGLIMIISGEYLRKLAMYTAQQSFSHLIQDKPNSEHRLITHGIYGYYRHPSYVGWFWWACGTQVLLANPICFFIYLIVRKLMRKEIIYLFVCLGNLVVFC